jgi:catechol 2,3-dioxygenase-like lactoylglutathione lyase family enzyme
MVRIDHVAVESEDPAGVASFYERVLGARIVKEEGHPVMAHLGPTAFAFHEPGGPGGHTAVRVSEEERAQIRERLERAGVAVEEKDHDIAVGLFFRDPDGRQIEAITYKSGDDPRKP